MKIFPIIPIWLMTILCIFLITYVVIKDKIKNKILEIGMVLLLFLINLRIMIPSDKSLVTSNNLDILFVIDQSISMVSNDYEKKERLDGVKEISSYIIENLEGARFSVITFDNTSKISIPYTKDATMAKEAIAIIQPKAEFYAAGSSLNIPKENIINSLKSSKEKKERIQVLFYISDGEITREDEKLESFLDIRNLITEGAVLGFGSTTGGTMNIGEKGLWGEYVMDNYGNDKAVSKIEEQNLKKIAEDLNIDYIHIEKEKDIYKKVKELKKLSTSSFENSDKSSYQDTYYFLMFPLLLLLLINYRNYKGVYK